MPMIYVHPYQAQWGKSCSGDEQLKLADEGGCHSLDGLLQPSCQLIKVRIRKIS